MKSADLKNPENLDLYGNNISSFFDNIAELLKKNPIDAFQSDEVEVDESLVGQDDLNSLLEE